MKSYNDLFVESVHNRKRAEKVEKELFNFKTDFMLGYLTYCSLCNNRNADEQCDECMWIKVRGATNVLDMYPNLKGRNVE